MKATPSFASMVVLIVAVVPAITRAQRSAVLENRAASRTAGSISEAVTREAGRLAAETARSADDRKKDKASDSDWTEVREYEGEAITLTVKGSPAGERYVVSRTQTPSEITVLNVADPSLSEEVRDALIDAASDHPEYFGAQQGSSARLTRHVRLDSGSVFEDDRNVVDLAHVVERVTRASVAEISVTDRAVRRGVGFGALAGGVAGLGIMLAQCGTHWNRETPSCRNLTFLWTLFSPGIGMGLGSGIGASYKITTVLYRAPDP